MDKMKTFKQSAKGHESNAKKQVYEDDPRHFVWQKNRLRQSSKTTRPTFMDAISAGTGSGCSNPEQFKDYLKTEQLWRRIREPGLPGLNIH